MRRADGAWEREERTTSDVFSVTWEKQRQRKLQTLSSLRDLLRWTFISYLFEVHCCGCLWLASGLSVLARTVAIRGWEWRGEWWGPGLKARAPPPCTFHGRSQSGGRAGPREGLGRAAELCACAGRRQLAALCDRCRRSACAQVLWKSGKINPSHTTFRSAASSFMKVLLQKTDRGEYRIPSTLPEISVNS